MKSKITNIKIFGKNVVAEVEKVINERGVLSFSRKLEEDELKRIENKENLPIAPIDMAIIPTKHITQEFKDLLLQFANSPMLAEHKVDLELWQKLCQEVRPYVDLWVAEEDGSETFIAEARKKLGLEPSEED